MYALLTYRHRLRHRIPGNAGRGAEGRCAVSLLDGDPMVAFMLTRLGPRRGVPPARVHRRQAA